MRITYDGKPEEMPGQQMEQIRRELRDIKITLTQLAGRDVITPCKTQEPTRGGESRIRVKYPEGQYKQPQQASTALCGRVRVNSEAETMLKQLSSETGLPVSYIASAVLMQAYEQGIEFEW